MRFSFVMATLWLGCGAGPAAGPKPMKWTTGFWFWKGSYASVTPRSEPLDVLFVQADGDAPKDLPPAREYWQVFRLDQRAAPGLQDLPRLVESIGPARRIQLDIDCPTRSLREYAVFLRELRKALAPGVEISITALLDWFRDGTSIASVLAEVDEFVPQFYDVQADRTVIAARFTAAHWGPVFNRYQRRYRIGISTFGRASVARGETMIIGDIKPLDFGVNPAFTLRSSRTDAGELRLRYEAAREAHAGYTRFAPGEAIEFVLASPESIGLAVAEAKRMGEYCAGVLFFRWPAFNETLTAQPDEVLVPAAAAKPVDLRVITGDCAAVHCSDLYLLNSNVLSDQPTRYRIESSTDLDYFLPQENMPARLSGPTRLEVALPPYCTRGRMYLGRAVSAKRPEFTISQ
jgi:hypothetical protein